VVDFTWLNTLDGFDVHVLSFHEVGRKVNLPNPPGGFGWFGGRRFEAGF
jgi:hypothetical protein